MDFLKKLFVKGKRGALVFVKGKRGALGLVEGIIGLAITVIVFSSVLMPQIVGADTTNWTSAEIALWSTVGVVAVAGILYLVYRVTSGGQ